MNDKFKKALPYITINTIGAILVLLCFLVEPIADFGLSIVYIVALIFTVKFSALIFTTIFLLIVNVTAFITTEKNKTGAAILCFVFCGSLSGFIAAHTVNKGFEKAKAVNVIFNVHLWLLLYLVVSWQLCSFDYYSLY